MTRDDFINQLKNGVKDFSGADLHGVNLSRLYLEGLNFKDADLSGCNLWLASLTRCNLENADLSDVNMQRGALVKVNLANASLDNARFNFNSCIFDGIEIDKNTMDKYFPSICPSEGEFVGWKKAIDEGHTAPVIVKLLIPKDAKRGSAFEKKCRCNKATVIGIEYRYAQGTNAGSTAYSIFDPAFKYELGKEVSVDNFDEDRSHECAPGIHFFMTREEAVAY